MGHPPHRFLSNEDQSRLMLWLAALEQAKRLLQLADRASTALGSVEVQDRDKRHVDSAQAYARSQPDYEPGVQKLSHFLAHDMQHPREFPDSIDCFEISDACRMLALIFFCQVLKAGYAEIDNVASNSRAFVSEHLDRVLCIAFPNANDRVNFDALRKAAEDARDEMLAHADASAFEVASIGCGMRHKLHVTALKGIDFSVLAKTIEQVRSALTQYAFAPAT
jgi:hypothetical protein